MGSKRTLLIMTAAFLAGAVMLSACSLFGGTPTSTAAATTEAVCEHEFGKELVPASCKEGGYTIYTCQKCGYSYFDDFTATSDTHYFGAWTVTKEATCAGEGEKTRECLLCGKSETEATEKLAEHTLGEWVVTKDATCKEDGLRERSCACGENHEEEAIKGGDHVYAYEITKKASCAEAGEKVGTCTVCGHKETFTVPTDEGHNYGAWTTVRQASCAAEGQMSRKCSLCGHTETKSVPKTEHSYGAWTTAKEPGCTTEGSSARTCSVCRHTETKAISALGHITEDPYVKVKPTCVTDGVLASVCPRCHEEFTQTLERLTSDGNHKWGEAHDVTKADCCHNGSYKLTCSLCGEEKSFVEYKNVNFNGNTNTGTTLPYGADISAYINSENHGACTVKTTAAEYPCHSGKAVITCPDCKKTFTITFEPEKAHNYAWVVSKEATEDEEGLEEHKCSICGKVDESRVVAKLYKGPAKSDFKRGNTVTFGSYEQDNNSSNGKEAINWVVVKVEGNKALLFSKYALDYCKALNATFSEDISVTWETSDLRKFAQSFYTKAFSAEEQALIQTTLCKADSPNANGIILGNDTYDKVFCISSMECGVWKLADLGFKYTTSYVPTAYANRTLHLKKSECGSWFRNNGYTSNDAKTHYEFSTSASAIGYTVTEDYFFQPAIWIDISSFK